AWLTALFTIMIDPLNAYEIVGVLREIFGASDHDLAVFSEGQKARFRIDEILSATGRISSRLRTLAEIRQRAEGLALFDAVTLIVEQTRLRERLLLLPAMEFGDLARELDALLAQAAEAEANGTILTEFAEHLRDDFTTPRAVRFFADDNAIQLITSHKAKGSEWQAVIVPFLARELRPPSRPYPHFVKSPMNGELIIAFGKEDKSKYLKDAIERAQQQELERLLYVATTRARHHRARSSRKCLQRYGRVRGSITWPRSTVVGGTNFSSGWIGKAESILRKSCSKNNYRVLPMKKLRPKTGTPLAELCSAMPASLIFLRVMKRYFMPSFHFPGAGTIAACSKA